jgi:hypothetical protein
MVPPTAGAAWHFPSMQIFSWAKDTVAIPTATRRTINKPLVFILFPAYLETLEASESM